MSESPPENSAATEIVLPVTQDAANALQATRPFDDATRLEQSVYETAYGLGRSLFENLTLKEVVADQAEVIAKKSAENDELETQAYFNVVTKLPNQAAFNKELQERINDQKKLAIAVLDVTNFKRINDSYGHDIGDSVLKSTGEMIEDSMVDLTYRTRPDDFVAHLHGDEFAVILDLEPREDDNLTAPERMAAIKEKITELMTTYARLTGMDEKGLGVSIGIVEHQLGNTAAETLALADAEMYKHKAEQHHDLGTTSR